MVKRKNMTVRGIEPLVHRKLRLTAKHHRISVNAVVQFILEAWAMEAQLGKAFRMSYVFLKEPKKKNK